MRLGYVFIIFPKVTETFNLREMLELQSLGVSLHVYSLLSHRGGSVIHPHARTLQKKTHYAAWFFSAKVLRANLYTLLHSPLRYIKVLVQVLTGTARSPLTFFKTAAIFPKSVYFARLAAIEKLDHIHATFASHNATCAMIMSELTGIPYSVTVDAYDLFVETTILETKLRRAVFVTTISGFNHQILSERYGPAVSAQTHIVRRGIDLDLFRPPDKDSASSDLFTILCVAGLQPKKGHRILLEALNLLHNEERRFQCIIVGDGPLKKDLRRHIEAMDLTGRVTMTGALPEEQVLAQMQRCDCFVLPSIITSEKRMEGIPNVLMEAMACERPVISTRISGTPELVEDGANGLLVEPGNTEELARAIKWVMDNPESAAQMGRAGREKVARDFELHRNVGRLWKIYQESLGDGAAAD